MGLQLPGHDTPGQPQRRATSPAGSLALPEGPRKLSPRPPSPLRNHIIMDTSTGIDPHREHDSDDELNGADWRRSPSPASSVSFLATSFVQRVNNFVGGLSAPSLPSDAELEAEAERERERSRKEAEAIMSKEVKERKLVEERVLEMLGSDKSLSLPPSRPYSASASNPPSPVGSQKEAGWWQTAKSKLTPTKDLTPAQQVIQDAKVREKEQKKMFKVREKEFQRAREHEWPAKPESKYSDPSFTNLNIPMVPPTRKPVPASPSSPTPSRPSLSNMPPLLTPSPMRPSDTASSSPSREAPPLYAQFNPQGTLDIPGTLLAIAKRFEKLEKWAVGHVRALEDRMNDVERWLVDKEKEKQETASVKGTAGEDVHPHLQDMREEITELQGRVGLLGREMAKLATSTTNLSSGPKAMVASIVHGIDHTSSVLVQEHTGSSGTNTPHHRLSSSSVHESTSPPLASSKRTPSSTRLPYPQGDYASPFDGFSPTNSPPKSLGSPTRTKSSSISGLPNGGPSSSILLPRSSFGGLTTSPKPIGKNSPTPSGQSLPPPRQPSPRQTSVSPATRKRYTVALGDRIMARSPSSEDVFSNAAIPETPKREGTPKLQDEPGDDDNESDFGEETIGKSTGSRLVNSATFCNAKGDYKTTEPSPRTARRLRTQSAYGFSTIAGSSQVGGSLPTVEPLKPKFRSKSSERLDLSLSSSQGTGTGDGMVSGLSGSNKFVDPLVLRKQSRDSIKPIAMPRPLSGKIPVGKLVAFFDGEKK